MNAPWYDSTSRLELSKFLDQKRETNRFVIQHIAVYPEMKTIEKWAVFLRLKNGMRLYGPEDGFKNVTMGEFLFADTYYFAYARDKNPEQLNKFIATLFRPRRKKYRKGNRDVREDFNETLIPGRSMLIEKLIPEARLAILFNYGAVRKDMCKKFTHLFPVREKTQPVDNKPISLPEWHKWMWNLADGNTDEDFDKVARSLCLNILSKIDDLIKDSKNKKR